jgi:hypothetical protein
MPLTGATPVSDDRARMSGATVAIEDDNISLPLMISKKYLVFE